MPLLIDNGVTWRPDSWVERLALERIARYLVEAPDVAVTALRALIVGVVELDLRPLGQRERHAMAKMLDTRRSDDSGIARTVRVATPAAAVDENMDVLVRALRGERASVVAPDVVIHMHRGEIASPHSRYGMDVVELRQDGRFYVENRAFDRVRSCTGRVAVEVVERVVTALKNGGFPAPPSFERYPGTYFDIAISGPTGGTRVAMLPNVAARAPGYGDVYELFDSWSAWFRASRQDRGASPGFDDLFEGPDEVIGEYVTPPRDERPPSKAAPMARPEPARPAVSATPVPRPAEPTASAAASAGTASSLDVKGWPEALAATASLPHALGALLGLAVGDALGVATRGQALAAPRFPAPATGPVTNLAGEGGATTDATQMAAAIADLFWKVSFFSVGTLVARYLDWQPRAARVDEQVGKALALVRGQVAAERAGRQVWEESGRTAASNASLVRTAVLGVLLAGVPAARRAASLAESASTHFDPRCQLACAALNAAIALGVTGRSSPPAMLGAAEAEVRAAADELRARYGDLAPEIDAARVALLSDLAAARSLDPKLDGDGVHLHRDGSSVRVAFRLAFWYLLNAPDLPRALLDVVNRGGDTTANAAVTGALLGAVQGVDALPMTWIARVLQAPGPRTDHADFHPRTFLRAIARGFGVERHAAATVALAPYVATAFPELRGGRDRVGLDNDSPPALGERIGEVTLETWLRGDAAAGQARGRRDGARVLLSLVRAPLAPTPPSLAGLPGVAPLIEQTVVDAAGGRCAVLVEAEPAGAPLSTPAFPLRAKDALPIIGQLVALARAAEERGVVLGTLRPELTYIGDGAVITGVAPRGATWLGGVREQTALMPGYAAPELRDGAATSKADVYSIASLLVFLTSRRSPVDAASAGQAAPLPAILDKQVAASMRAALDSDPARRPTLAELQAVLAAAGIAAVEAPSFVAG